MTEGRRPVRLVLMARTAGQASPPLLDYMRKDPTYGQRLTRRTPGAGQSGLGETTIAAVLAPGALVGLFRLVRAWIDLQRTQATVRVRVHGSEVEVRVDGRTDPARIAAEVLRLAQDAVRDDASGASEP
jgi:hypothetical protein